MSEGLGLQAGPADLLVSLIAETSSLTAFGADGVRQRGACPWHPDPSESLFTASGVWHCFACGAGGDAVGWIMRRDTVNWERACSTLQNYPFLQGNVVMMPRTCETALFVGPPVASSFFIVGCFPALAGAPLPARHASFLQALASYMATRTFRYLCFVNSRRMTIDRANTELSAVLDLPWPFGDLSATDWENFAKAPPSERDAILCEALGLPPIYQNLVEEFTAFREGFADGKTPLTAMRPSEESETQAYLSAMVHELDGGRGRYDAGVVAAGPDLLAAVVQHRAASNGAFDAHQFASEAAEAYRKEGASSLTQSLSPVSTNGTDLRL